MERTSPEAWQAWQQAVWSCGACPLAQTRTRAVDGNGNYRAQICLFGEAPGREEDASGQPFSGQAGAILDQFLAETGIARAQLYIGNVVKCRPVLPAKRGQGYRNRKPSRAEQAACAPHLRQELALLRPQLLITLGAVPLGYFLGQTPKMADWHGRRFIYQPLDLPLFPLYHPAAVIYRQALAAEYRQDLAQLKAYLQDQGLVQASMPDPKGGI